jgi:hypothetical protein
MSATRPARPGRRPDPALRVRWQQRLAHFERSGLSAAAFCAQHKLSLPSFYAWRRRLRQPPVEPAPDAPRLLPVQILSVTTPVELLLPGGLILRLAQGCDLTFVRALVTTLGAPPC